MLFRRRQPQNLASRIRTLVWPRRSYARSFEYFRKRVLRLNATPHAIAAGFAAGVFASFTPFIGFHFLLAFALAYLVAGNMAAAALGTVVGNPVTFPFIWGLTYEVGQFILRAEPITGEAPRGIGSALVHVDFASIWAPFVKPMLVGSLPVGLVSAALGYGLVYSAARSFQKHRARRILARRQPPSVARLGAAAAAGRSVGEV